jgi:hypothetical protein
VLLWGLWVGGRRGWFLQRWELLLTEVPLLVWWLPALVPLLVLVLLA